MERFRVLWQLSCLLVNVVEIFRLTRFDARADVVVDVFDCRCIGGTLVNGDFLRQAAQIVNNRVLPSKAHAACRYGLFLRKRLWVSLAIPALHLVVVQGHQGPKPRNDGNRQRGQAAEHTKCGVDHLNRPAQ